MVIDSYNYMNNLFDERIDFFNHGYAPSYPAYDNNIMKNRMTLYRYMLKDIITDGMKVLDVGCGRGGFSRVYKDFGFSEIHGCDITPSNIRFAQDHYKFAKFTTCDAHYLTDMYQEDYFDVVTCLESAHHYMNRDKFFEEVKKILKKDGVFVYADVDAYIKDHFEYIQKEDITENVKNSAYDIMIECERLKLPDNIRNLTKHAYSLYTLQKKKYIKYICCNGKANESL